MPNNKPFKISGEQLRKLCPNLTAARATTLAGIITECFNRYGLNTVNRAEELLSTIIEETGGFATYTENLNYSASSLLKQWPSHFTTTTANQFGRTAQHPANQEMIANLAYDNRMGNGSTSTGDGWLFRGRGAIQLTGRALYTLYAKKLGKRPEEVAPLLIQDYYAIDSACWYFVNVAGLTDESERDEFMKIVKTVNGGYINLDTRIKYLNKVKAVLN